MSDVAQLQQNHNPEMTAPPAVEEFQPEGCEATWHEGFRRFAEKTAASMGTPWAFGAAAAVIIIWAVSGPIFHYSDTWQLVINTGTTIVTFLMVFLIQNTQNRDARAMHLKLSELVRASESRNRLIDVEDCSEAELNALEREFKRLREHHLTLAKRRENQSSSSSSPPPASPCAAKAH